jgi:hypothetical protein
MIVAAAQISALELKNAAVARQRRVLDHWTSRGRAAATRNHLGKGPI